MYHNEKRTYIACITCKNHWFCLLNMQICGVFVAGPLSLGSYKKLRRLLQRQQIKIVFALG